MDKKRVLAEKINRLLDMFPIVAVIGPRQCSKSTLVRGLRGDWKYYDLESPDVYQLISSDPVIWTLSTRPSGARSGRISSYFQIKNICQCYDGNLFEFILDHHFGIRKIISFYDMWNKHSLEPGDFLLIRYEEMKKDLFGILKNSLSLSLG